MADLRNNLRANTEAGIVLGLVGAVDRFIVYGVPMIYDAVVGSLGRWGEGVFSIALGFVLDFVDQKAQFLERMRIPGRFYIYGLYRLVDEAIGMIGGRGFAYIKSDGSIATDPSDTVSVVYMQKGDTVYKVQPGSRTAVMGVRRYVAAGTKRVFHFEAPYELPQATA